MVEAVKVSSGFFRRGTGVESGAEDLHPEKGEDAHEQEEQKEKGGNTLDGVGQGGHQVGKRFPVSTRIDRRGSRKMGGKEEEKKTRVVLWIFTITHTRQQQWVDGGGSLDDNS